MCDIYISRCFSLVCVCVCACVGVGGWAVSCGVVMHKCFLPEALQND